MNRVLLLFTSVLATSQMVHGQSYDWKSREVLVHRCERSDGQVQFIAEDLLKNAEGRFSVARVVAPGQDWQDGDINRAYYFKSLQQVGGRDNYLYQQSQGENSDEILITYKSSDINAIGAGSLRFQDIGPMSSNSSEVSELQLENCVRSVVKAGDLID